MGSFSYHVGQRIKKYRKSRGYTIEQFSAMINKSKATLSKYENGTITIDIETLYHIAQALNIDLKCFIDYQPPVFHQEQVLTGNFYFNTPQAYMYYFDGRIHQLVRSLLRFSPAVDGEGIDVILYMGVKSFDLAENDEVISVARIEAGKQVLAITQNGYGKRTDVSEFRVQSRGGKGIMAMRLTDKTGLMAAQLLVSEDEDIMLITDDGTIIRMPVSDISVIGRVSQGVRVMRVEEGSRIVCVTATERDEDEQDESEDGQTEADSLDMDVGGENSETQPEETDE